MARTYIPKEIRVPPVYNKARLLVEQVMASTKKAPREMKYNYIASAVTTGLCLMEEIFKANKATENNTKVDFIDNAIDLFNKIKMQIRIIHDVNAISTKGFSVIINYEADIIYQLTAWKNSLLNIINTPKAEDE